MHIRPFVMLGVFAISIPAAVGSSTPAVTPVEALVEIPVAAVGIGVDVNVNVQATATVVPVELPIEPSVESTQPVPTWSRKLTGSRWEGGLAFEVGRFGVNHVGAAQFGLRAHVGRQLGPLRVAVEGTFGKFSGMGRNSWDEYDGVGDFGGEVHRIGVGLRYRAAAESEPLAIAGYIDLGAGRQRILWNGGGETLDRSDVMIGLGYEIVGGRHGFGGMDMGVRFMASPTVDPGTSGCIQVCATSATPGDHTRDLGVMFVIGALFGL